VIALNEATRLSGAAFVGLLNPRPVALQARTVRLARRYQAPRRFSISARASPYAEDYCADGDHDCEDDQPVPACPVVRVPACLPGRPATFEAFTYNDFF
jgi:hypothetical protein